MKEIIIDSSQLKLRQHYLKLYIVDCSLEFLELLKNNHYTILNDLPGFNLNLN